MNNKLNNLKRNLENPHSTTSDTRSLEFRMDDAIPMMDGSSLLDYTEVWLVDDYYETHISLKGLAKTFKASPAHSSSIHWKANRLAASYIPSKHLSREDFYKFSLNFFIFGNGYLERVNNRLGKPLEYRNSPALNTRRMREPNNYLFLKSWSEKHYFDEGSIYHFLDPDVKQEIYGEPQYLGCLQSVWLGESATLFRRKYYLNGSHAGYILYLTDTAHKQKDIDALEKAMAKSKGPGNFRNLLMYAPGGKKDGLQVLPLAEATAKDEFFNISRATRSDILIGHRIPPQLLGMAPENVGGFGDANTADQLTYLNEIMPVQNRMLGMNDFFEDEVIKFKDYEPVVTTND
jgi:PBSX family phage portal protein